MTAETSINPSSSSPVASGEAGNSPQPEKNNLPWARVVRGEPEAMSLPPTEAAKGQAPFSECSPSNMSRLENNDANDSNAGSPNKPAWKKPLSGVVGVAPVIGGAGCWPALSESTRPVPKSTSESSKPVADQPVSSSKEPVVSRFHKKQANSNRNPNSTPNNTMTARQRSSKRSGGHGGGTVYGGFSRPPPPPPLPPPFPYFEIPYRPFMVPMVDNSVREPFYNGNSWEARPIGGLVSKPHALNDQSLQQDSSRKGNFTSHSHGDGSHHDSDGVRRDQDRHWNAAQSSNVIDVHADRQVAPFRGFIRSPPLPPRGTIPFPATQPMRPFGNPIGFDVASPFLYFPTLPPEPFMSVPFVVPASPRPPPPPPPPHMFFPGVDPSLPALLLHQIDYYFSDANLVKDEYLRSNMDDQGWVPIRLIAGFPRVQHLTSNIHLILDSLRASTVVEVQDGKVRRRNEWKKWIPNLDRLSSSSGSKSPSGSVDNMLATPEHGVEGNAESCPEVVSDGCLSAEMTGRLIQDDGECSNKKSCST